MNTRGWLSGLLANRPTRPERVEFPDRLLIVNHWWAVEVVELPDDQIGECKPKQLRILIDAEGALAWSTLWHEIGHAVWWELGVHSDGGDDLEEQVVNTFCQGLLRVVRDNPTLKYGLVPVV